MRWVKNNFSFYLFFFPTEVTSLGFYLVNSIHRFSNLLITFLLRPLNLGFIPSLTKSGGADTPPAFLGNALRRSFSRDSMAEEIQSLIRSIRARSVQPCFVVKRQTRGLQVTYPSPFSPGL